MFERLQAMASGAAAVLDPETRSVQTHALQRELAQILHECRSKPAESVVAWLYGDINDVSEAVTVYHQHIAPVIGQLIHVYQAPRIDSDTTWDVSDMSSVNELVLHLAMVCEYAWQAAYHTLALANPVGLSPLEHRDLLSKWLVNPEQSSEKRKQAVYPMAASFVGLMAVRLGLLFRANIPKEDSSGEFVNQVTFMSPVYHDDGVFRYTYQEMMSVAELIDVLYQTYINTMMGDSILANRTKLVELFSNEYSRLPMMKRRQGVIGFNDGCLDLLHMRFYAWEHAKGLLNSGEATQIHYSIDFPFPDALARPEDVDEARLRRETNTDCDDYWPPHDKPFQRFCVPARHESVAWIASKLESHCPAIHRILSTQRYDGREKVDICGLLGRVLLPNQLLDDFAVALMFIGRPRTGKTTMANLVNWWFDQSAVGKLMPAASAGFSSSEYVGRQVVVIPEGSSKMSTSRGDLNTMFAGEMFSFNQKFKRMVQGMRFRPHVIGATNSLLNSTDPDPSLSLQRRIQYVEFLHGISNDAQDFGVALNDDLSVSEHACLAELARHLSSDRWRAFVLEHKLGMYSATIDSLVRPGGGDIAYDLGRDVKHQAPWALCLCRLAYEAILIRMENVRAATGRQISLDQALGGSLRRMRQSVVRKHYKPCVMVTTTFETVPPTVFNAMSADVQAQWTMSIEDFRRQIEHVYGAEQSRRLVEAESLDALMEYCELHKLDQNIQGIQIRLGVSGPDAAAGGAW